MSECITNLGHVMSNQTGKCLGCGIDLSSASVCSGEGEEVNETYQSMSRNERIKFLLDAIKALLIFGSPEERIRDAVVDLELLIFPDGQTEDGVPATRVHDFVMQLLTFIADEELHGLFWWRTDGEYAPITFWTNSNDLLAWGCADGEEINEETLPLLKQAVEDCKVIDPVCGAITGCELFACRMNKMRPQGAAYPKERELWPLFDACGPERAVGIGNPYSPGECTPSP